MLKTLLKNKLDTMEPPIQEARNLPFTNIPIQKKRDLSYLTMKQPHDRWISNTINIQPEPIQLEIMHPLTKRHMLRTTMLTLKASRTVEKQTRKSTHALSCIR